MTDRRLTPAKAARRRTWPSRRAPGCGGEGKPGKPGLPLLAITTLAITALEALANGQARAQTAQDEVMVLPTITVVGGAGTMGEAPPAFPGGQVATGVGLGVLGNVDYMQTPFSITAYTAELVRDKQVTELRDIAILEPSLALTAPRTYFQGGYNLRGFPAQIRFNGLKGVVNTDIQTDPYERIEIIEGPNALLFGGLSGLGGTLNLVPKRAGDEPLTRAAARFESQSEVGGHFDVGRRYGPDGQLGIRANFSAIDGEAAVDEEQDRHLLGALAVDLRLSRVRASFDLVGQRNESRGFQNFYTPTGITGEIPDPENVSSGVNTRLDAPLNRKHYFDDWIAVGQAEIDVTDTTLLKLSYGDFRGTYNYVWPTYDPLASTAAEDAYTAFRGYFEVKNDAFQASATQELDTGPLRHRLTLAYDRTESRYYNSVGDLSVFYTLPAGDYDDPPDIGYVDIDDTPDELVNTTEEQSVGLVNSFGPADGSWSIVAGLRRQEVSVDPDGYETDDTTGSLGALARINDNISVYGNYAEGLEAGQVVPVFFDEATGAVYENAGEVLPAYTSESYEVGVKMGWDSVGATAALFQITRPSVTSTQVGPTTYRLTEDGEQVNRGLELNVFGEPVDGLRLVAGAALIDPELTNTEGGANDGNVAPTTPKRSVSLYGEWDVRRFEGLTLSAGLLYRSRQYADAANSAWIDGYTTVDAGLRYEPPWRPGTRLAVDVLNVLDNEYWANASFGSVGYGDPRTVKASLSAEF